jgi:DMSO/TMAO reductase YedYZ molybdopterin-dependent catalytic subunit
MLVHSWNGEPLTRSHGGPARLLIPHVYLWKSAKWLRGIDFLGADKPAFGRSTATTCVVILGPRSDTPE